MTNAYDTSDIAEFRELYANEEVPALPPRLSRYRFVSCLADGENKKTWLLENSNGQKVLCKFARGAYMTMLRTESTFFTLGKFPFIPYVFNYFEAEDGAYLLREYIEGPTLSELVEKNGPLSLEQAVPIMKQLCGYLSRFHDANPPIIYRDLKPANIVLHPSGDCYLIDTGTARTYQAANDFDTVYFGTPYIAAPEQFGARQTDNRTDIYALGILFYYLLTGELKIDEIKLKKLPKKAVTIIKKCTAFDPDDRYSQVSEIETGLRALCRDKKSRRALILNRVLTAAAVCCALLMGALFLSTRISKTSKEIVFSSPLLEQAVREELGKLDGSPIYENDLAQVTRLFICGNTVFHDWSEHFQFEQYHIVKETEHGYGDIADISLLEKMPNLQFLVLDYQNIQDISSLAGLPLSSISLCGNPIRDLSALQNMNTLEYLYIAGTQAASLTPLSECRQLVTLDCSYSPVTSLEPLLELPIDFLFVSNTLVTDWSVLNKIPIGNLCCNYTTAETFKQFADIPTLRNLTLQHCNITSLHELADFSHLTRLDIAVNPIGSLEGIEAITDLEMIILSEDPIRDLSPLAKLKKLYSLDIATGVENDYAFLSEMPQVTHIQINSSQLGALYNAVPEPWFEIDTWQ